MKDEYKYKEIIVMFVLLITGYFQRTSIKREKLNLTKPWLLFMAMNGIVLGNVS